MAITTDAPFHVPGALGVGDEYFTLDEVIDACNAKAIKVTVGNCCETKCCMALVLPMTHFA